MSNIFDIGLIRRNLCHEFNNMRSLGCIRDFDYESEFDHEKKAQTHSGFSDTISSRSRFQIKSDNSPSRPSLVLPLV